MARFIYSNSLEEMVVRSFLYRNRRYVWSDCDCLYYSEESDEDYFSEIPDGADIDIE